MDVDGAMQHQAFSDRQIDVALQHLFRADVASPQHQGARLVPVDMSVGEFVDRGIQNDAAELVTIGGKVGASAGQPQTQRCSGANIENIEDCHGKSL